MPRLPFCKLYYFTINTHRESTVASLFATSLFKKKCPSHTTVSESLHNLGHCTPLLTDGDVDGVELLPLIVSIVEPLLVDDGVYSNRSLTVYGCSREE